MNSIQDLKLLALQFLCRVLPNTKSTMAAIELRTTVGSEFGLERDSEVTSIMMVSAGLAKIGVENLQMTDDFEPMASMSLEELQNMINAYVKAGNPAKAAAALAMYELVRLEGEQP